MTIAVLGTGIVGQAHAEKLAVLGDDVMIGTHDVAKSKIKTEPDILGRPGFGSWLKDNPKVKLGSFREAAAYGEFIIEAISGMAVVDALESIKDELNGKTLVDISNPLDFSKGRPPTLFVCNDDSLGERIQKVLPQTNIVKAFNTANAAIQVDPASLAGADHHMFIAGNDQSAKDEVTKFAQERYGWRNVLDLGDIKSARGLEMIMPIWLQIMGSQQTPQFNFKIVS